MVFQIFLSPSNYNNEVYETRKILISRRLLALNIKRQYYSIDM